MGFYDRYILPRVIDWACGQEIMAHERSLVVPQAHGRVLEVGVGSGHNFAFYDPARVTGVVGVDPSGELLAQARQRSGGLPFEVELLQRGAEEIPLEAASIDTVLLTFTLCTIPAVDAALAQMRRVLKPGGELLFCEHGLAPDAGVRRWQNRITPLWKRCFGGCHLNRDMPALLQAGGFRLERVEGEYLKQVPRFAGYRYLGVARAT